MELIKDKIQILSKEIELLVVSLVPWCFTADYLPKQALILGLLPLLYLLKAQISIQALGTVFVVLSFIPEFSQELLFYIVSLLGLVLLHDIKDKFKLLIFLTTVPIYISSVFSAEYISSWYGLALFLGVLPMLLKSGLKSTLLGLVCLCCFMSSSGVTPIGNILFLIFLHALIFPKVPSNKIANPLNISLIILTIVLYKNSAVFSAENFVLLTLLISTFNEGTKKIPVSVIVFTALVVGYKSVMVLGGQF